MAKIIERTPEQIEQDRRAAAQARERLIQKGVVRDRQGLGDTLVRAPKRSSNKVAVVVNPFTAGKFDPKAAEKAPKKAAGNRTNIGAGTAKGPGGSKPSKGTSNPTLAAKRARKAAQVKHRRGRGKKR